MPIAYHTCPRSCCRFAVRTSTNCTRRLILFVILLNSSIVTTTRFVNSMTTSSSSSSNCCPPGSHGSPKIADWEGKPQGTFLTYGEGGTPIYYTTTRPKAGEEGPTSNKIGLIVYTDVWGYQSRLPLICDKLVAAIPGLHIIVPDCFRGNTMECILFYNYFP